MEVTQKEAHITHAVVGASETIEMGMSSDAALMHILSSALYTHPELATVREPICNAWDAHISAGVTDKPIEITLESRKISIKDFGFGIPHDKIGQIYGVYGNSTKRDDSTVTGGFGLGSKAPFAYVDLFEVVSCNEGTKTIYRVSKSSMDKGGKPAINKVVSMPTEETGITVSFGLKDGDLNKFTKLVQEVIILGGIKATVNGGDVLEYLPVAESPTGYVITGYTGTNTDDAINLRYGNVVYPVPFREEYAKEYNLALKAMGSLWRNSNVIFMAEPNSVSIAPSRESLILTDATVQTIKQQLSKFDPKIMETNEVSLKQLVNEKVNQTLAELPTPTGFKSFDRNVEFKVDQEKFSGPGGMCAFTLTEAFRKNRFNHMDRTISEERVTLTLLNKMLKDRVGTIGLNQKLAKALRAFISAKSDQRLHRKRLVMLKGMETAIRKEVITPLLIALRANPKLTTDRLHMSTRVGWGGLNWVRTKEWHLHTIDQMCGFIFKKVIIGTSIKTMDEYAVRENRNYARLPNHGGRDDGSYILYRTAPNEAAVAEAVRVFTELGYEIHNTVVKKEPKEIDPNAPPPAPKKAYKKRKGGYLSLNQSYCSDDKTWLLATAREQSTADCAEPIAYVQLRTKSQHPGPKRILRFGLKGSAAIANLFGDKIAVVTTAQAEKLKEKGVPELKEFVASYVDEKLSQSPEFKRYLAFAHIAESKAIYGNVRKRSVYGVMSNMAMHKDLMDKLGLRFSISPDTALLVAFAEDEDFDGMPRSAEIKDVYSKHRENPMFNRVFNTFIGSPWFKFVDMEAVQAALDNANETSEDLILAKRIIGEMLPFKKLHSKQVAT